MTLRSNSGLHLEIRDLVVAFDDRRRAPRVVLDIAQFALPARAQAALCAPSGAGKTTLLNVLAGIELPLRGEVRWGAIDVAGIRPSVADLWRRETLGLVFQQFHLFKGLCALENVLLPSRFVHRCVAPDVLQRARMLLERVGVPLRARVDSLSRGEMQRVAVARALVHEPAVVLADEPTASLDRETASVVEDLLCTLCRESGATLVVATHDARLAARLDARYDIVERTLRPAVTCAPVAIAA